MIREEKVCRSDKDLQRGGKRFSGNGREAQATARLARLQLRLCFVWQGGVPFVPVVKGREGFPSGRSSVGLDGGCVGVGSIIPKDDSNSFFA